MHPSRSNPVRIEIRKLEALPPLSPQAREALAQLHQSDISLIRLADFLKTCPSVTARLLGLANSAYFGRPGRVQAIEDAVVLLGLNTVKSLAAGLLVAGSLDTRRCRAFEPSRFWFVSFMTAVLAQHLGSELGAEPETAYTGGLLVNFGLLVLAHAYPEALHEILSEEEGDPLSHRLRQRFQADQYQAAGWLALRWQFPDLLRTVVSTRERLSYDGPDAPLVRLVGVCRELADQTHAGEPDEAFLSHCPTMIGIAEDRLRKVVARCTGKREGVLEIAHRIAAGP